MAQPTPICTVDTCSTKQYCRSYCNRHYEQIRKHGAIQPDRPMHQLTEIDKVNRTAVCAICGPTTIRVRKNHSAQCRTVRDATRGVETPEARRNRAYLRKYGVEIAEVERMLIEQRRQCAICETELDSFHVDHDHSTGIVRGILCHHCNVGLGHFRDNTESLLRAIKYLSK